MTITTNPSDPLIVVVGSTGLQGGSVITNLEASSKPYRIRGLTRDVSKPKAQALVGKGVEVVSCNLVVGNKEGIEKAFQNATYVFIMTNFWEHLDGERETAEGNLMVDCAKSAGVKLVLLSTIPNANKASNGELTKVFHFDSKAFIADHARAIGIPFVEIQACAYMNNFITFCRPRPVGDGSYVMDGSWSEGLKLPLIDTLHDYGLFVRMAIESDEFNKGDGKVISAYGEWLSIADQLKVLSDVTGKKVAYNKISYEQNREAISKAGLPPHAVDDMIEMFKFHEFFWAKVLVESNTEALARRPRSFREYCEAEDWSQVFV